MIMYLVHLKLLQSVPVQEKISFIVKALFLGKQVIYLSILNMELELCHKCGKVKCAMELEQFVYVTQKS